MKVQEYDNEDDTMLLVEWDKRCDGVTLFFQGPFNDSLQMGVMYKFILYRFCKKFIDKMDKERDKV